jgi:hypothetical protein
MCVQTNCGCNHSKEFHQNDGCSGAALWSRKKKLEKLNACLSCMLEQEADIREAIEELNK